MSKLRIVLFMLFIVLLMSVFYMISISIPLKADSDDTVFERVGGDDFLNVTLKYSLKTDKRDIPDGTFSTSLGEIKYYDAKNITYVGLYGHKDYFIIWKTDPNRYDWVDRNEQVNQYVSCYLIDGVEGKCFVEYSYEYDAVYGVMLSTATDNYTEAEFIYNILGLNPAGFDLSYDTVQYGGVGYSSAPSSHYHTVVPDRYTLSRVDPGAYYDHYEYGDNYDIDDYLESEGFD